MSSFVPHRRIASPLIAMVALMSLGSSAIATAQNSPSPREQTLRSPGGTIELRVSVDGPLTYSVRVDGQQIIGPSKLGLKLRGGTTFGQDVELVNATKQSIDQTWENPFGRRRIIRDHYNELHLLLREQSVGDRQFEVVFRAFNDGVAFRYELLSQPGSREFVLEEELTQFAFSGDYTCYAGQHEQKGVAGPQEWEFVRCRLSDIQSDSYVGLPLLVETPAAWVALAEADLLDWSGMWLANSSPAGATASPDRTPPESAASTQEPAASAQTSSAAKSTDLPGPLAGAPAIHKPTIVTLVARLAPRPDKQGLVKSDMPHHSAWRVFMIGRWPGRLIESEIIHNLATPSQIKDTSWIKPGMMAWDHWWTGDTIMTTAVIKQYIQLAADMGWPYQLIDAGWYGAANNPQSDITKVISTLNMDEVRRFAAEKNVRLWLWLHWTDVDRDDAYEKAFPLYQEWGIAGVKIDFMDRDDQEMVNWYEKITRAAADNHLMIDFHGAMKPTGFDRTFPNQITREGVLGNEYNKWSKRVTPEHKVTLPFTRYLLGPGDFTPGGFLNRQPDQFKAGKPTQVQGTRAGELALFVVYDSPICCVCDHPNHYQDAAGIDLLQSVPTVWDDTCVLDGAVGKHIAVARRRGDAWYMGGLTNSEGRELELKLDFLTDGRWKMRLWRDAANADADAEHLATEDRTISADDTLKVRLAPAGGFVARLTRE